MGILMRGDSWTVLGVDTLYFNKKFAAEKRGVSNSCGTSAHSVGNEQTTSSVKHAVSTALPSLRWSKVSNVYCEQLYSSLGSKSAGIDYLSGVVVDFDVQSF